MLINYIKRHIYYLCICSNHYFLLSLIFLAAFLFKHCLVASAVFGATKPWQLADVIEASKVHLAAEIISEIDEVHARYGIGRLYSLLVKEFVTN